MAFSFIPDRNVNFNHLSDVLWTFTLQLSEFLETRFCCCVADSTKEEKLSSVEKWVKHTALVWDQ